MKHFCPELIVAHVQMCTYGSTLAETNCWLIWKFWQEPNTIRSRLYNLFHGQQYSEPRI